MPPIPDLEEHRVAALRALDILDSPPEAEFDALVRAAALACNVPISLVSLIDAERQWFKANFGLPGASQTSRDVSFCAHAINADGLFEVPDATLDARFADNPSVAGEPRVRFYTGAPLRLSNGACVGTLCVIDRQPRSLDDTQREILRCLASVAARTLETRQAARAQKQAVLALHASEERARHLLEDRARRQAEYLRLRDISAIAEGVPQIVWRALPDASLDWLSERFTDFTGVATSAALAFGWGAVVPANEQSEIVEHFEQGRRTCSSLSFEHRLWHASSASYRDVLVRANPLLDEAGCLTGWVGTSTDVDDDRRAREHDNRASEAFQRASLPQELPRVPGFVFSADYQAAKAEWLVGGDWYDAFQLADGRIVLSVGDVMGTGLHSAVTMAAVRQSIRGAAQLYPEPTAVLDAADRALRIEQPDRIVTAFVGIVEPITGFLTYASAGHPLPLYRAPDGQIVELSGSGLPLGLRSDLPELRDTTHCHQLHDASLLVLYTDGLTEATRDTSIGETRIRTAIVDALGAKTENIARFVRKSVLKDHPKDDVAVLTLAVDFRGAAARGQRNDVQNWIVSADDAATAMATRHKLAEALRQRGATEDETANAELIFGELLGNVVRHTTGETNIVIDFNNAYPVLHVLDKGPGFFYTARLPRDVMSESGRGLFIAAALARDVSVTLRPDGGSHARAVFGFSLKGGRRRPALI